MKIGIIAITAALLTGCADTCANSVLSRADAPGGQFTAVMFQRDCGATTGFSTQVSILKPGDRPSGGGNAFSADDDHGAAVSGRGGGPWVETRWLRPDHLLIRYAAKSRISKRADSIDGVRVTYEPVKL